MRYVSLFSGIEAATVAWEPLGWGPMAFSEIEAFPCAVLSLRFPNVPNLGDVSKVDWRKFVEKSGRPDLVVGGSPCQSFSVAGKREGLEGASGLMWEFVRAVAELRPRWVVWENVPGALSSSHGEDFRCLLESLDELGYRMAWRVLDAQFFGVAQRRRRVFLVGDIGAAGGGAAEVLLEPEGLCRDHRSSREKRKDVARAAGKSVAGCFPMQSDGRPIVNSNGNGFQADGSAYAPNAVDRQSVAVLPFDTTQITSPQNGDNPQFGDPNPTLAASNHPPAVCIADDNAKAAVDGELCGTLKCGGSAPMVASGCAVRRLTPTECERLQGFPSVIELGVEDMTSDELIACALASGDVFCDFETGKVYGTRGPGGVVLKKPKELGFLHPSGYIHINLSAGGEKKQVRAHRVVYMAAYGAIPEGMMIDHINNEKTDNRLSNLQMMTPEGNSKKAAMEDRYPTGEKNGRAKLTADMRASIIDEYRDGGTTYRKLAEKYGVSKSRVCQIVKERGFTEIPYRGKPTEECPDGPRYKALGNSMAVPVMRWIGERIDRMEER